MRTRNLIYSWLVVFCVLRAASAQTGGLNIMSAADVAGDEGESVTVSVRFANVDPVQAWTVVLCHDPRLVELEEVRLGRDVLPLEPDFVNAEILASGFRVGVVLSLEPVDTPLPPGQGQEAHTAVYRLVGEGAVTTPLEFCTVSPGGQTFENVFVVEGQIVGVDERLILDDGSIAINAPECPRNFKCRPDHVAKTVVLSWEVPTSNSLVGYEIRRNGGTIVTLMTPDQNRFTDSSASGVTLRNTTLNYALVALFRDGDSCEPLRCSASLSSGANVFFDDGLDFVNDEALQVAGFRIVVEFG